MLPASTTLRAAHRLADLFRRNSVSQAMSLVAAGHQYADIPATEYREALDWMERTGLVMWDLGSPCVDATIVSASDHVLPSILMMRALEADDPAWLYDVGTMGDADDMPIDALNAGEGLGIAPSTLLSIARRLGGKVDLELRAQVGARGEEELVRLLSSLWPTGVTQVSLASDGFGYDIALDVEGGPWHLEVKSTTRRGRLVVHLSRHEFEIGLVDPFWELVVVALDEEGLVAVATADKHQVRALAPTDSHQRAPWEAAKFELLPTELTVGLSFLGGVDADSLRSEVATRTGDRSSAFAWLPAGTS